MVVSGSRQQRLDLPVAFGDLVLVVLPAGQSLAQSKQMLLGPGTAQRFLDALRFGALIWVSHNASNCSGLRSPRRIARTTAKPLVPVSELITWCSLTFMRSSAF